MSKKIRLDQTDLNANNLRIENVASGTAITDVVNYGQLLSLSSGLTAVDFSSSAYVSITGNDIVYGNKSFINNIVLCASPSSYNHLVTLGILTSSTSNLYSTITSASSDLNSSITTASGNLFNYVNSNTASLYSTITSASSNLNSSITTASGNLFNYVNSNTASLYSTITSVSSDLNSSITTVSGNLFNYVNSNTSSLYSTITSASSNLYNYINSVSASLSAGGSQSSTGYVSLTGNQSVSGNKIFANLTVTNPTDGSINDGFFDNWVAESTPLQNMLDDISEAFLDLAPAKAGLLSGNLTLTNTTKYSAILPSGLSSSWYVNATSGTTVSDYIVDNTYTLASPNTSTAFRTGKASDDSTRGIIYHLRINNASTGQIGSYSASSGVGSSGTIQVTSSSAYNTFWHKTNAQLNVTQTAEGYEGHYMSHSDAGTSNQTNFYYDPVNSAPSFSVNPIATTATVFYKYMSNVPYYTSNTVFTVSYTGASGIFNRAYHPTNVSIITGTGGSSVTVNPASVPNYLATFPTSGSFTLNTANRNTNNKYLTVALYKPNGTTTSVTGAISYGINTFGTSSTTTAEYFLDETYRVDLTVSAGATAVWNSQTTFDAINAGSDLQVRNGTLTYPVTGDYVGLITAPTGDKFFRRIFTKASANGGNITFGGIASVASSLCAHSTGVLNVYLYLPWNNLWFDLGKSFGSNNGDGTGSLSSNSKGARVSSATNSLVFSFGTDSTANNENMYQMYVLIRNSTVSLTSIVTS